MLHADRYSRPVTHNCIMQQLKPSSVSLAAVDRLGRAFFFAPEPESFGYERNMYTAAQHNIGQSTAGIASGSLLQPPRHSNTGEVHQQDSQLQPLNLSLQLHEQISDLGPSSSASFEPSQHASAARQQQGAGTFSRSHDHGRQDMLQQASHTPQRSLITSPSNRHQASALTEELLASPQGYGQSSKAQQQSSPEGSSWVVVTTAGDVVQISSITAGHHQVLAALQTAMMQDSVTAPLSGCDLGQHRLVLQANHMRAQQQGRLALRQCPVLRQNAVAWLTRTPDALHESSIQLWSSLQAELCAVGHELCCRTMYATVAADVADCICHVQKCIL